jgi:hypothetical protein
MRLTVLQHQTKSLDAEVGRSEAGTRISKWSDCVKYLWHGKVVEAQQRLSELLMVRI